MPLNITANFGLTIITGHYGCGKTNLALNIASSLANTGNNITLIDLDIVNPYFRSSDNLVLLQSLGVSLLGPVHATNASNLDTPSLQPGIEDAIRQTAVNTNDSDYPTKVILDVGGDPDGARALARFRECISNLSYQMIYVVNFSRPETLTVSSACTNLDDIQRAAGLKVTAVFSNTHLMEFTTVDNIIDGAMQAKELCSQRALPLMGIACSEQLFAATKGSLSKLGLPDIKVYPVTKIVATPWG
jgi:hypothetical protein